MQEDRREQLKALQSFTWENKVLKTQAKILEFVRNYGEDGVCISFSGGKDSTVLLHIVRQMFPHTPAIFFDTGLEYPEIRNFVKEFDNVEWIKPAKYNRSTRKHDIPITFVDVLTQYGYPVIGKEVAESIAAYRNNPYSSKALKLKGAYGCALFDYVRWLYLAEAPFRISPSCCYHMKKNVSYAYTKTTGRYPITGQMASESIMRKTTWMRYGCNIINGTKYDKSNPMSFWTEQDVFKYLLYYNLPIAECYGDIVPVETQCSMFEHVGKYKTTLCDRTGCVFCMFGVQNPKLRDKRFKYIKDNHSSIYDYCMSGGKFDSSGMWIPHKGLGMSFVLDWIFENKSKG